MGAHRAWRTQRTKRSILSAATVFAVFFFAQAYVGALKTTQGFPITLLALHVATAAATWAAGVVLVVVTGWPRAPSNKNRPTPRCRSTANSARETC